MFRIITRIFAVIGALCVLGLIAVVALGVALVSLAPRETPLPGRIVLSLDLDHDLAEGPGPGAVSRALFGDKASLRDLLDALERAGSDDRVKGIYARIGDDAIGLARTQEVRDAIAAFRAKGKFAVAFADTFGEFGPGTRPYYLATAFDDIWLQPMGNVGLTGLTSETPFAREALDRLGIVADFDKRSEYKTVMNSLTEPAMTAPQREEVEGLLSSLDGQIVRDIAAARKIPEAELRAAIDRGPLFADEAQAGHLVDHLGYRDEALRAARQQAGDGAKLVKVSRYLDRTEPAHDGAGKIALIYGTGLMTREGGGAGLLGDNGFDTNRIAAAFRQAVADSDVRAILFRIDSRGGSVVAAETVWREVQRARLLGKPVIASMGDIAASGGYYIAAPADKIVAEPATLTGSIGVVAGKLAIGGLLQKLGITVDAVDRGASAGVFSMVRDFSPAMQQRLSAMLDRIYAGFKDRVRTGRGLAPEAVEALAKGRVWSGAQAKEKGLVDALGGYDVALGLAREAAKIPRNTPVELVVFPRRKGELAELLDRLSGPDDDTGGAVGSGLGGSGLGGSGLGGSGLGGGGLGGIVALARRIEALVAAPGTVEMPPLGEVR